MLLSAPTFFTETQYIGLPRDVVQVCMKYRAFHNVLHDYKHLQQENQRTYLNGTVHSHRKTEKVF